MAHTPCFLPDLAPLAACPLRALGLAQMNPGDWGFLSLKVPNVPRLIAQLGAWALEELDLSGIVYRGIFVEFPGTEDAVSEIQPDRMPLEDRVPGRARGVPRGVRARPRAPRDPLGPWSKLACHQVPSCAVRARREEGA